MFSAPETNMVAMGISEPHLLVSCKSVEMPLGVARRVLPGNVRAIMAGRAAWRPK